MRNNFILSNWVKKFHAKNHKRNYQTLSQANFNLLQRNYLYLSTIIDLYNRKIIAYKISEENNLKLVIETLKSALLFSNKEKLNGSILDSDQGF